MTNLISFDGFNDSEIRVTDDGRYSVYDVIRFCGQKNPHQVWSGDDRGNGLRVRYSEVSSKCENFKFAGKGQRETPVADKETCLEILRLLKSHPDQVAVTSDKFYPRTETQIVAVLSEAFQDLSPIKQFNVHGYRIDLYLATPNIAIEIDEGDHSNYCAKKELERERSIKSALGCSFVRFNPYSLDFNLGQVIRTIRGLL